MQSDVKIAIIPDTNVFTYSKKRINDLSRLPLDEYYKILKTLELNDLTYEVNIFFPEIVLLELLHHLELKLNKKCKDLENFEKEFKNFEEITIINNELNIKKVCENLKKYYFEELNIIPIPSDGNLLFNKILDKSINKKPPFIESSSDKGFKDAILFLSLLKFAEDNKYDKYVLFSNDNGFSNNIKELQDEFKNHLASFRQRDIYNDLVIIKNKNINSYINTEFKLFTDLKEYIANNFFKILEKKYEGASVINMDINSYEIDSFEILEDDTDIHQYDNNEFEVEFFLDIWFYCPKEYSYRFRSIFDDEDTKTINQSESYIFRKENDEWNYYLNSRGYDIDFD